MSFALAAALLLSGAPRFLGPPETQGLSPGDAAPFFFGTVRNADAAGKERFDLAQLVGPRAARRSSSKTVLLGFFSRAASRKQLADLQSLYTQYKERGLVVALLTPDPARLLQGRQVTCPVVEDPEGAITRRYLGTNPHYPAAVIVDRYGRVVSIKQGYPGDPSVLLRRELEAALR